VERAQNWWWQNGKLRWLSSESTPHLHYGTSSCRRASHRATLHDKHCKIVMISTIETFYQRFSHEEANGSELWGPGIFHQVIFDESHRLRTSVASIGKFRNANGTLVEMDCCDYNKHMASGILSLEPQYKWMLMATPLGNGIEHLHWILHFLESSSWLTLQLLPDTFDYTPTSDNVWVADRSNLSGTKHGARFTPVADPYKNGPEFESRVHCTTMAGDTYMLPLIGEEGKVRKATQTLDILIQQHRYEDTIGKRAFPGVCTLIPQQTMVSHILFKNPKPNINIPPMHVNTELETFTKSFGAGQFYIISVDGSNKGLRERITRVASAQATTTGKTKPFRPRWRLICLISITLILAPARMDLEITSSRWVWSVPSGVADTGRLKLIILRTNISEFAKAFPGNISKMYFSHWKPPGVSERMWSVSLDASISGEYQTLGGHSCRPSE